MTVELDDIHRLRVAFQEDAGQALDDGAHCPSAERLIDAEAGSLARPELSRVLDHVGQCPACTDAWRLAASARNATEPETGPTSMPRRILRWRRWSVLEPLVAAAAGLAIIVGIGMTGEGGGVRSAGDERLMIEVESPVRLIDGATSELPIAWQWPDAAAIPDRIAYRVSVREPDGGKSWHRSAEIIADGPRMRYRIPSLRLTAPSTLEVCVEVTQKRDLRFERCRPVDFLDPQ